MNPNYVVFKDGIVTNLHGRALKGVMHKGYLCVNINKHKVPVHRLVAERYILNPEHKPEVHHKDYDKLNNHYTNLMWVTRKEHLQYHKGSINEQSKLDWAKVDYIRENILVSTNDLAEELGVSAACISLVKHNKSWKIENHP